MRRTVPLVALAIASCSEPAPPPVEQPQTYSIRPADLWADPPRDICRAMNADFLRALIDRQRAAGFADPQLIDFNVVDDAGGKLAVLRFRSAGDAIVSAGAFTAATCEIGPMRAAPGTSTLDLEGRQAVTVD